MWSERVVEQLLYCNIFIVVSDFLPDSTCIVRPYEAFTHILALFQEILKYPKCGTYRKKDKPLERKQARCRSGFGLKLVKNFMSWNHSAVSSHQSVREPSWTQCHKVLKVFFSYQVNNFIRACLDGRRLTDRLIWSSENLHFPPATSHLFFIKR